MEIEITMEEYKQLIKAQQELELIKRALLSYDGYDFKKYIMPLFFEKGECEE